MNPKVKTTLLWVLAIFIVYAILTSPDRAGDILQAILDVIVNAISSIGSFFDSLLD